MMVMKPPQEKKYTIGTFPENTQKKYQSVLPLGECYRDTSHREKCVLSEPRKGFVEWEENQTLPTN